MMLLKRKMALLALMASVSVTGLAQQQVMDSISRKFDDYRKEAFQEKIFVHVDQDFYLTGELLWFRVYYVDGTLHKPASISKVAFVELLDKKGSPVVQSKVGLDEDGGHGSLFIPATLATGNYVFRVYTRWMRNFSPDYFFEKQISVVNPFVRPETIVEKKDEKIGVEFFPEGGNLVAGHRSRLAFKVTDASGNGISGAGAIIRNEGDTIARFSPLQFGLGSFWFTPSPDDTYRCVFTVNGATQTYPLPQIYREGYSLSVTDSTGALRINVKSSAKTSALPYAYVLVHARQSVLLAEAKPIYPADANFVVPANKIPEGITHITVFDGSGKPACERLYFKAPKQAVDIRMSADAESYTTRRKVSLGVTTAFNGKAVPADVSLSVYRLDSLSGSKPDNMLAYLYLASDLQGNIESPEYYFSEDPAVRAAADNLMLTHGWRRFRWDDVLNRKTSFSFVPEVRSHLVTGKVTKKDGSPAPFILTYLSSPGKLVNVYGARSNKDGLVHFEVTDFWGSRRLIMQTNTETDSAYTLSVVNAYDPSSSSVTVPNLTLAPSVESKLAERSLAMQVQDVYYREVADRIVAVKNDSTAFFGDADETYLLDDFTRFPVMEEVMREYVPGVLVRKRRDGFHFLVVDRVNSGVFESDPLVLLDGMPVFDIDRIMSFDPLRVKRLEVITRNFYLGPLAFSGIVSYSTYQGDLAGFEIDPRSLVINYEGLQLQREFYSPLYENQRQRGNRLPDRRTLLHWDPKVKTGSEGKATIDFYTSDTTGDFIVVAQGLGSNGSAGTSTYKFTVKRADF